MTLRDVIFLLGILLMAISLFVPFAYTPGPDHRIGWSWGFSLGLTLALGAHGWPEGIRN